MKRIHVNMKDINMIRLHVNKNKMNVKTDIFHVHIMNFICSIPTLESSRWRRGRAFASHVGDRGSTPGWDRPKSLKQVVTASLPNAGHKKYATIVDKCVCMFLSG